MGRKRTKNWYWFPETDQAVKEYNEETIHWKKQRIFNEELYYPLYRLCEYIINTVSNDYIQMSREDKILWLMSELTMVLDKIDSDQNPFSYLQVSARNHVINENRDAYEKKLTHKYISQYSDDEEKSYLLQIPSSDRSEDKVEDKWNDVLYQMTREIRNNKHQLSLSKSESKVIDELILVMEEGELYQMTEMTKDMTNLILGRVDLHRNVVRKGINTIRNQVKGMYQNYIETGNVNKPREIVWVKRPASMNLPLELQDKDLFQKVIEECKGKPVTTVFKKFGIPYKSKVPAALEYGQHYPSEIQWVEYK